MGRPSRVAVAPKQSLGQNFLVDDNIARNIARDLNLRDGETVVEIGPGQGALTKHLSGTGRRIVAVEIDGRVIEGLRTEFAGSGIEILHGDFLAIPLAHYSRGADKRVRLVGNIPYHLTSPILFKAYDEREFVSDVTIMVQREVARRIVAAPSTKEYGILSVLSRFYGTPEILFNVSPNCFYPRPKVTSSILRIAFFDKLPYTVDTKLFRQIVKATFGKRRKTLRNGLSYLALEPELLLEITRSENVMLERRPEQLRVEEFAELTAFVQDKIAWRKPPTT